MSDVIILSFTAEEENLITDMAKKSRSELIAELGESIKLTEDEDLKNVITSLQNKLEAIEDDDYALIYSLFYEV